MTEDFSTHEYNRLILIPAPLGEDSFLHFQSPYFQQILKETKCWIAESARSLRRFLSACKLNIDLDILVIEELNNQESIVSILSFLEKTIVNQSVGLISDAGMPALADPGASVVAFAHKKGIKIEVIPGPSSIIMALCGSGFNGQGFSFHGYSPAKTELLVPFLKKLPQLLLQTQQTQIWMETPYRTDRMLELCIQHLNPTAYLSVAVDLQGKDEAILTHTLADWKKLNRKFGKLPAVFSLGQPQ